MLTVESNSTNNSFVFLSIKVATGVAAFVSIAHTARSMMAGFFTWGHPSFSVFIACIIFYGLSSGWIGVFSFGIAFWCRYGWDLYVAYFDSCTADFLFQNTLCDYLQR